MVSTSTTTPIKPQSDGLNAGSSGSGKDRPNPRIMGLNFPAKSKSENPRILKTGARYLYHRQRKPTANISNLFLKGIITTSVAQDDRGAR